MSGTYELNIDVAVGFISVSNTSYTFSPDGRFYHKSSSETFASSGRTAVANKRDDSAGSGHYFISGYGIELRYDSGRVEHRLFGTNTKGLTVIWIGSTDPFKHGIDSSNNVARAIEVLGHP